MNAILNFDKSVILFFNDIIPNCPFLQKFFSFITTLGNSGILWIIIATFFCIKKDTRKKAYLMLFGLLIGHIIGNGILKNVVKRPRPFLQLELLPFITAPSGFSFPSGHSLSSFLAATFIFYINKKCGILAYIMAFLIALSRVVLIVHYPSDVITGAILGITIAITIIYIYKIVK